MTTVVLLAGGKSSRMGTDKLMLPQQDTTVLEQAVRRFSSAFDRICVSVARLDDYPGISAEHIADEFPGSGPMAGIHAGLRHCGPEGAFFCAADLPFSDPGAALLIMEKCPENAEICVVAGPTGRPEPLFGFYRASVLPRAEELLLAGRFRMRGLLDAGATCCLTEREVGEIWSGEGIANMNTPEDYRRLLGGKPLPEEEGSARQG